MIVLLLMLSGHHFYHHSCKSRQNPGYTNSNSLGVDVTLVMMLQRKGGLVTL